jgi:vacuolar-type H+-ATPase subunit E/Vma4
MLNLSSKVLRVELETAKDILQKWLTQLEEGLPVIDVPADADHLEQMLREIVGELRVVSGKCDTLAEILAENLAS